MITVLMCAYNETEKEIRLSIESILKQSYKEFEFLIILDDPENKSLKDIILEYSDKDSRIRFVINSYNMGLVASLNKGLSIAKGEYIARMDADDISSKNRLKIQKEYLDTHKSVSVISGDILCIDTNNNVIEKSVKYNGANRNMRKILGIRNIVAHPCVMYRKKDILDEGGYRNIPTAEDYDLWARLLNHKKQIRVIDRYLLKYRIRESSISTSNAFIQRKVSKYIRDCINREHSPDINYIAELCKKGTVGDKEFYRISRIYYNRMWDYFHKKSILNAFLCFLRAFISDRDILCVLLEECKLNYSLKKLSSKG